MSAKQLCVEILKFFDLKIKNISLEAVSRSDQTSLSASASIIILLTTSSSFIVNDIVLSISYVESKHSVVIPYSSITK